MQFNPDTLRDLQSMWRQWIRNGRKFTPRNQSQPLPRPARERHVFFGKLTDDLSAGGNAKAQRMEWPVLDNAAEDYAAIELEDDFTVYDRFWKELQGESGDKILYTWDGGERVVLQVLNSPAKWIELTGTVYDDYAVAFVNTDGPGAGMYNIAGGGYAVLPYAAATTFFGGQNQGWAPILWGVAEPGPFVGIGIYSGEAEDEQPIYRVLHGTKVYNAVFAQDVFHDPGDEIGIALELQYAGENVFAVANSKSLPPGIYRTGSPAKLIISNGGWEFVSAQNYDTFVAGTLAEDFEPTGAPTQTILVDTDDFGQVAAGVRVLHENWVGVQNARYLDGAECTLVRRSGAWEIVACKAEFAGGIYYGWFPGATGTYKPGVIPAKTTINVDPSIDPSGQIEAWDLFLQRSSDPFHEFVYGDSIVGFRRTVTLFNDGTDWFITNAYGRLREV